MSNTMERVPKSLLSTLADAEARLLALGATMDSLDREPLDWEAMAVHEARRMLGAVERLTSTRIILSPEEPNAPPTTAGGEG
jgi:hypothetical protein